MKTLTLNDYGKATFRWKTDDDFYYEVYYDNDDYVDNPFLLNASYILRSKYLSERNQTHDLYVDDVNILPSTSDQYKIQERFYTSGSQTIFGNKKIIKANLTPTNMNDQISNVSIYYIDKDNSTGTGSENLILFKDDYSQLPRGPLGSNVGAHTEYHYLHEAKPKGNWAISTFRHNLSESWFVRKTGDQKVLSQKAINPNNHWHPMIVTGDVLWENYTVKTSFVSLDKDKQCGVAFRYNNDRCYYFLGVKKDTAYFL